MARELRYDAQGPGEAPREIHAYVDRCVFVDGQHVYMGKNCPHYEVEDETGPIINPSWTVQSKE